jgi:hypothetical protein
MGVAHFKRNAVQRHKRVLRLRAIVTVKVRVDEVFNYISQRPPRPNQCQCDLIFAFHRFWFDLPLFAFAPGVQLVHSEPPATTGDFHAGQHAGLHHGTNLLGAKTKNLGGFLCCE